MLPPDTTKEVADKRCNKRVTRAEETCEETSREPVKIRTGGCGGPSKITADLEPSVARMQKVALTH